MLASLLPPGVAVAEIAGDEPCALLPEEAEELGEVSAKRRRDYTCGRECAHRALRKLGLPPVPILTGAHRQPLWPEGICGSITHAAGYCAAAVAPSSLFASIGVDAEVRRPLRDAVFLRISLDDERAWIRTADSRLPWDILLFSAKESVFKAWFPLAGTWLGFREAQVRFDPAATSFHASILADVPGAPREIDGRFHVGDGHVYTSAVIPASPR